MFKSFVSKYLKVALNELFVDPAKDSIQLSVFGADLFSDSNVHLKNLTFRPDLFDTFLYPMKLVYGYLGDLCIEGIAELAFGGKIRIQVDSIYLLFRVETIVDPEYLQYLKKLMIELQSGRADPTVIGEILKHIQGFGGGKDPDFQKQRLLMIQMINYFFKSFQFVVKTLHVRVEVPSADGGAAAGGGPATCSALGFTLPYAKLAPVAAAGGRGAASAQGLSVSNLQVGLCSNVDE